MPEKKETFYSSNAVLFPMDFWFGDFFLAPQNKGKKLLLLHTRNLVWAGFAVFWIISLPLKASKSNLNRSQKTESEN